MSAAAEFDIVDAVLKATAATSGVDAFAVTAVQVERQMRKLFTRLACQST